MPSARSNQCRFEPGWYVTPSNSKSTVFDAL